MITTMVSNSPCVQRVTSAKKIGEKKIYIERFYSNQIHSFIHPFHFIHLFFAKILLYLAGRVFDPFICSFIHMFQQTAALKGLNFFFLWISGFHNFYAYGWFFSLRWPLALLLFFFMYEGFFLCLNSMNVKNENDENHSMYLGYFEHVWHSEVYFFFLVVLQQVVAFFFFTLWTLHSIFFLFVFHCQTHGSCACVYEKKDREREKDFTKKRNLGPYFF